MGTYTEFNFYNHLKSDTPEEVINFLDNYIKEFRTKPLYEAPTPGGEHPFFKCGNWFMLFNGAYAFNKVKGFKFNKKNLLLSIHSEFKNYDDEINLFIDWISPYIQRKPGAKIAHSNYSNDEILITYFLNVAPVIIHNYEE